MMRGSLAMMLRRANKSLCALYEGKNPGGLSLPWVAVLGALIAKGPINQTEIVAATDVDRSTLGQMLPLMVAAGVIHMVRLESDRRTARVSITPKGRAAFITARRAIEAVEGEIIALVRKPDRAPFLEGLARAADSWVPISR